MDEGREDVTATPARRAMIVAPLVMAAVAAALLLTACGSGEPTQSASPSPATIRVTPGGARHVSVNARVGDIVVVSLAANPTTGYGWTFTAGRTLAIRRSRYVPDPNPNNVVGSGGTQVVTLEVTAAGTSELVGRYARSWETPSPGAGPDVTVTVTSVN